MSEQTYAPRYRTFPADSLPPGGLDAASAVEAGTSGSSKGSRSILTWAILSACMILWAVIGFVFWVPLVLSAMIRFTFDLSRSMLRGDQPAEAGRTLREAVSFYRRGFSVAVDAVFGKSEGAQRPGQQKQKSTRLSARRVFFDVLWTVVFWYLFVYATGLVEASPLDGWIALIELPWVAFWGAVVDGVSGGLAS